MPSHDLQFSVIGGEYIQSLLSRSTVEVINVVEHCYLRHHRGDSVNPDSYFLTFNDKPEARIIALPAAVRNNNNGGSFSGIKWIASYPRNIESNLQRASAVIVLNDYQTGYPFACLEASQISAARTAASAVLAAGRLGPQNRRAARLGVIGGGLIASTIIEFFKAEGWTFEDVCLYDICSQHCENFVRNVNARSIYPVRPASQVEALSADIVVLATTAGSPWIPATHTFVPSQLVLNISLRDIPPETILACNNILDDVDHCMKANTSPHLAEQRYGHRDFISGTLAELILGQASVDTGKPTIFSPFGLGVLDLEVAMFIYQKSQLASAGHQIPGFFSTTRRWAD
ncbi:2,3-diaminopropionate biosynthesis protein SbnB [Pseudomonas sp. 10B1]|uniref:2,3-diaminopropionate biosynthesis protein SbnB n=1 Tax=unclassified Pseudomonas TaxID=196821 RepID=UPI002B237BA5|nr:MULTISPECIES: 2,3-diaminopropionate biosynthesis protein SbnB [unclassified Pseudomonas]MEA9997074.1 2,3-diaminopropionate biosynthesis protein SbnB [Pseudomonas sp. AA4]MEB0087728.1 2,3-diaminopropionate biosynthesis protein SbnB [Pseudomonas sp. RTI1]MEB0124850.1 2,3-diaminopropionate biosynthesis protein SbnB [Pseudomonas sp. CCC1.2]MEB0153579.1 2,3-diaminopropionate biosynthesis protein SbnB [Pseudomonas sp. CCC4.3]MEB0217777.1 2,3-diaminopropionate biosynthesis protein SbnB [Pseudomona